jgi:hypothetical protein
MSTDTLHTTDAASAERALFIVAQHLQRAQRSHAQAMRLQAQGECAAAHAQSRMTRVLLHNALHHIQAHAAPAD